MAGSTWRGVSAAVLSWPRPHRRWSWSKLVNLKLGSRAGLRRLLVPQGSKFAVTVCNCTHLYRKSHFLSVSQPRLLRVGDCLPGAWRDSVLYGVCSGSCQREGRALSDQGPGPLVRFRLREGRRWCQGSPMQTPCSWPVTSADVSPSSRVSQLRAPQGLPCPISLFPVPGSSSQD